MSTACRLDLGEIPRKANGQCPEDKQFLHLLTGCCSAQPSIEDDQQLFYLLSVLRDTKNPWNVKNMVNLLQERMKSAISFDATAFSLEYKNSITKEFIQSTDVYNATYKDVLANEIQVTQLLET